MTRRSLGALARTLALFALGFCACSCDSGIKGLMRATGERWVLAAHYVHRANPDESGPPSDDWVATIQIPDGTIARLVSIPMKTPDWETVLFPRVAYNEPRKLLICEHEDSHDGGPFYNEVWRYDLATGQSRWITKGRWNNTCGFAWSPDGSKVAFVASTQGSPVAIKQYNVHDDVANKLLASEDNNYLYSVSKDDYLMRVDVRTAVMQYDVLAEKLEEVAGDACRLGSSSVRPRRPVYSEDGNWLYYVSMDQQVMRVDLRTKRCERLPLTNAIAVLTVRGEHLVYAKEVAKGRDARFQIVKVGLDAPDDSHSQLIHAAEGVLGWNLVSPSRRFILFQAMGGYSLPVRVVDLDRGTTYGAWGLLGEGDFRPQSTVFVESCP